MARADAERELEYGNGGQGQEDGRRSKWAIFEWFVHHVPGALVRLFKEGRKEGEREGRGSGFESGVMLL